MGELYEINQLQKVVYVLLQALSALQDSRPMELIEAEVVIPFVGTLARKKALPDLSDFRTVSLLTEDIERSNTSDIWSIRIMIKKAQAISLRLEKYDTSTTA